MDRGGGLTARLTLAFLAVSAVTLVVVLVAVERVTTDSFDSYTRHVAMMRAMMGTSDALPDSGAFIMRLRWSLVLGAIGGAAVSMLLGVLLARRVTRPLRQLREAASRIAEGDTSVRVAAGGTDEVAALGVSFNSMAAALGAASESRKRFVADVAHELRTPLAVLQGELEAMQDGLVEVDAGRLESLLEETHFLARIVEDLRTLSLFDAGELRLVVAPEPVRPLLERSVEAVAEQAAQAGAALSIEAPPALPDARVDRVRIEQVLRNLFSNAIRHSPRGGVVTLRAERDREQLRLRVEDGGAGIPPEAAEQIFERFYRADPSRSRESGGSGLGLAIARALAEAHGGSVQAWNRAGGGAAFEVTLPLAPRPAPQQPVEAGAHRAAAAR
jgi:signal transduction histidine kinase